MTLRQEGPGGASQEAWARAVVEAVRGLRFGSVEIVVHDGRVVQVETRDKVGHPGAGTSETPAGPPATSGGVAPTPEDTSK